MPFLKYRVFFLYAMRRVQCFVCGVRSEFVPWSNGKHQLTIFYMKYLADLCRHLLWKEVASQFHTSWHKVFVFVRWVVGWGLKQRSLEGITALENSQNLLLSPTDSFEEASFLLEFDPIQFLNSCNHLYQTILLFDTCQKAFLHSLHY